MTDTGKYRPLSTVIEQMPMENVYIIFCVGLTAVHIGMYTTGLCMVILGISNDRLHFYDAEEPRININ